MNKILIYFFVVSFFINFSFLQAQDDIVFDSDLDPNQQSSGEVVLDKNSFFSSKFFSGVGFLNAGIGCIGTLVAPRVVLTVAHCVVSSEGSIRKELSYMWLNGDNIGIEKVFVKKGFNKNIKDDWAFILLEESTKVESLTPIDSAFIDLSTATEKTPNYVEALGYDPSAGVFSYQKLCSLYKDTNSVLQTNCLDTTGVNGSPIFISDDGTTNNKVIIAMLSYYKSNNDSIRKVIDLDKDIFSSLNEVYDDSNFDSEKSSLIKITLKPETAPKTLDNEVVEQKGAGSSIIVDNDDGKNTSENDNDTTENDTADDNIVEDVSNEDESILEDVKEDDGNDNNSDLILEDADASNSIDEKDLVIEIVPEVKADDEKETEEDVSDSREKDQNPRQERSILVPADGDSSELEELPAGRLSQKENEIPQEPQILEDNDGIHSVLIRENNDGKEGVAGNNSNEKSRSRVLPLPPPPSDKKSPRRILPQRPNIIPSPFKGKKIYPFSDYDPEVEAGTFYVPNINRFNVVYGFSKDEGSYTQKSLEERFPKNKRVYLRNYWSGVLNAIIKDNNMAIVQLNSMKVQLKYGRDQQGLMERIDARFYNFRNWYMQQEAGLTFSTELNRFMMDLAIDAGFLDLNHKFSQFISSLNKTIFEFRKLNQAPVSYEYLVHNTIMFRQSLATSLNLLRDLYLSISFASERQEGIHCFIHSNIMLASIISYIEVMEQIALN